MDQARPIELEPLHAQWLGKAEDDFPEVAPPPTSHLAGGFDRTRAPAYTLHQVKREDDIQEPSTAVPDNPNPYMREDGRRTCCPGRFEKKRFLVPLTLLIIMIVVAGVLGGVLGVASQNKAPSTGDNSPKLSDDKNSNSNNVSDVSSMGAFSQIAASKAGTSSDSVQDIIFQNPDHELVAVEWLGSTSSVHLLTDLLDKDKIPTPIEGSPLHLIEFGSAGSAHLFYIDDAMRLGHLVRRSGVRGKGNWEIGALSTTSGRQRVDFRPSKTLRLSVTAFTEDLVDDANGKLVIMCQRDDGDDKMSLISSTDPNDVDSWTFHSFDINGKDLDMPLNSKSSGLLLLPFNRTSSDDDEAVAGMRMLWELADESRKTTFGELDCNFNDGGEMSACSKPSHDWKDSNAEQEILDAAKPLLLSAIAIGDMDYSYLVRAVDRNGNLTELLWENGSWTNYQAFSVHTKTLPDGLSDKFTSVASVDEGIMYAVSEGKILEFARQGAWWKNDDAGGWRFNSVIDTAVSKD